MLNDQRKTAKCKQIISAVSAIDRFHSLFFFVSILSLSLLLLSLSRLV